ADAVGGDHRHHVGAGMALHDALPVVAAVDRGVLRLGADRRRIEQQLGALQRHRAGAFREPLVPADADAEPAIGGAQGAKAGIAGIEVAFPLMALAVGNVRLAIEPELPAVGVDHHQRVVVGVVGALEEADRQHNGKLGGDLAEPGQRRVAFDRMGEPEQLLILVLAEIGRLEQLLQQDDLRPVAGRPPHHGLGLGDIGRGIAAAGELGGRYRDLRHAGSFPRAYWFAAMAIWTSRWRRLSCCDISRLATMTPPPTRAMMMVASALISGLSPSRTFEKITIGSVVAPGPVTKLEVTKSSSDSVKESSQPDR